MSDLVDHPPHYKCGVIEVIDFIEDQKFNYHRGNAVKYVCRAGRKSVETEIQDLEKAIWYLNREIKRLKAVGQFSFAISASNLAGTEPLADIAGNAPEKRMTEYELCHPKS